VVIILCMFMAVQIILELLYGFFCQMKMLENLFFTCLKLKSWTKFSPYRLMFRWNELSLCPRKSNLCNYNSCSVYSWQCCQNTVIINEKYNTFHSMFSILHTVIIVFRHLPPFAAILKHQQSKILFIISSYFQNVFTSKNRFKAAKVKDQTTTL
jgi:hypothetical protein